MQKCRREIIGSGWNEIATKKDDLKAKLDKTIDANLINSTIFPVI